MNYILAIICSTPGCGEPISSMNEMHMIRMYEIHQSVIEHGMKPGLKCAKCIQDERIAELENEKAEAKARAQVAYEEYLQSKQWRCRADACKERAGHRCQICNAEKPLEAHHRTYSNLGFENPEDLVALCRDCHELFSRAGRLAKHAERPILNVLDGVGL